MEHRPALEPADVPKVPNVINIGRPSSLPMFTNKTGSVIGMMDGVRLGSKWQLKASSAHHSLRVTASGGCNLIRTSVPALRAQWAHPQNYAVIARLATGK